MNDGKPVALVLDFDGTVSEINVGMAMIRKFARDDSWLVIDEEYGRGTVGSRQAYRLMGPLMTGEPKEWTAFAMEHRLDPRLPDLIGAARERGWEVEILSDGFDTYIEPMLGREGLNLPGRYSLLTGDGTAGVVRTPYMNPLCGRCGTCKTDRILELSNSGYYVIFVGDGYSDLCAAPRADRIFAKDVLARHLEAEGRAFSRFDTLGDVYSQLFD